MNYLYAYRLYILLYTNVSVIWIITIEEYIF